MRIGLGRESTGTRRRKRFSTKRQNNNARRSGRYIIRPMKMRMPNSFAPILFSKSARCPQRFACLLAALSFLALPGRAQNQPVRVIAFGAHPDDCDLGAGGLAAKYAAHEIGRASCRERV